MAIPRGRAVAATAESGTGLRGGALAVEAGPGSARIGRDSVAALAACAAAATSMQRAFASALRRQSFGGA